jgi:hypothetical protein
MAEASGEPQPSNGETAAPAARATEDGNDSIRGELSELRIRIQELQRRVDQPWE